LSKVGYLVYLKELTLRGFKSFALPTTLRFQPGITAVVGPNGSGKSNIVDALAWVMGEQAARQLRGSSMQDVIFAGTATRPSLGRAQVSLTIDNSDHALNIEYSEVTISRTIYRNGGSEYSINGQPARLLDVQDLLSDAGLGSQMHVIIGQGQLSRILNADPQGHRAIIDEAAGVLKHRKRKERSLRRLDSTQRNLQRLDDIIAQLSKQLGPLERQSRAARKAGELSEAIAQHKALLFADQLRSVETAYHSTLEQLTTIRTQLKSLRRELAQVKSEVEAQELTSQASDPQIRELAATLNSYQQLSSRLESLDVLTSERVRALTGRLESLPEENHSGEILRARAAETMSDATASEQAEKQAQEEVEAARRHREELEKQLVSTRRTLTELRESARKKQGALTKLVQLVAGRQAMNQASQARLTELSDQLV
ncbi:MAG: AAA family ATPase, partial [Aeriscardovia aeriphila]|nr:AAA family ATPase [Aeriscardovia aeriphila]